MARKPASWCRDEPVTARNAPAIVKAAGRSAEFAWEEFFQAEIANAHTRKNYLHAVQRFLAWVEGRGLELPRITPGDVGAYIQGMDFERPDQEAPPGASGGSSTTWSTATLASSTRRRPSRPSATRSSRARRPRSASRRPARS